MKYVVYLLIPTSNHNLSTAAEYWQSVVYLLIPTSNHNSCLKEKRFRELYIFWFLHQTTTGMSIVSPVYCCISFDSYIKPQLVLVFVLLPIRCISFDSYIKPQPFPQLKDLGAVVYLLIPTSNHNFYGRSPSCAVVVYLLIPTSNHNFQSLWKYFEQVVYLLIPTSNHNLTHLMSN